MSCNSDGTCGRELCRPGTNIAHCTVCCVTFGGLSGFDRHRKNGVCLRPETIGLTLSQYGYWVRKMEDGAFE